MRVNMMGHFTGGFDDLPVHFNGRGCPDCGAPISPRAEYCRTHSIEHFVKRRKALAKIPGQMERLLRIARQREEEQC